MSHPGDWSKYTPGSAHPEAGIFLACVAKKRNRALVGNKVGEVGRSQVMQGNNHDDNICELF